MTARKMLFALLGLALPAMAAAPASADDCGSSFQYDGYRPYYDHRPVYYDYDYGYSPRVYYRSYRPVYHRSYRRYYDRGPRYYSQYPRHYRGRSFGGSFYYDN